MAATTSASASSLRPHNSSRGVETFACHRCVKCAGRRDVRVVSSHAPSARCRRAAFAYAADKDGPDYAGRSAFCWRSFGSRDADSSCECSRGAASPPGGHGVQSSRTTREQSRPVCSSRQRPRCFAHANAAELDAPARARGTGKAWGTWPEGVPPPRAEHRPPRHRKRARAPAASSSREARPGRYGFAWADGRTVAGTELVGRLLAAAAFPQREQVQRYQYGQRAVRHGIFAARAVPRDGRAA